MSQSLTEPAPTESWHLQKSVPIALILGLLAQTGGFIWWASKLEARVEQHTMQIVELKAVDTAMTLNERRTTELLARLDERLQAQNSILQRIEGSVNRGQRQSP